MPANPVELIQSAPHLWSPLALAASDMRLMGKSFDVVPHLELFNREALEVAYNQGEGKRVAINCQQQVAKSTIWSKYYPAWRLLLWPQKQIVILAHEDDFAGKEFGLYIRDVIERWGGSLGVKVRKDTHAKGAWQIEGTGGGVTCRGRGASVAGLPVDDLIIDDLLRDATDALSDALLDANWDLVSSVVRGRLRAHTNLIMVGTRWTRRDHFGRMYEQARITGEKWKVIRLPALAEENDPLGRKPGAPLWPKQIAMRDLLISQQTGGRWWSAAWQQRPEDESGSLFKPRTWPVYGDLSGHYGQTAWSVPSPGGMGGIAFRRDITVFVTVDWASSERRTADYTGVGVWGLLEDGRLLALEVTANRWPLEECVKNLAGVCRRWKPDLVAVESGGFQTALAIECRRYPEIGEVRRLKHEGKAKHQRALPAVVMAENGRILLPEAAPWLEAFVQQLQDFSAEGSDHDDMVDVLSYAAQQAAVLKPQGGQSAGPQILTPGREPFW